MIIANRGLWDYILYQAVVDIAWSVERESQYATQKIASLVQDFKCNGHFITRRVDYFGVMVSCCARIMVGVLGGQIMCSIDITSKIEEGAEHSRYQTLSVIDNIRQLGIVTVPVGEVKLKGIELPEMLTILYSLGLESGHDLKEEPTNPSVSTSCVQFSVPLC